MLLPSKSTVMNYSLKTTETAGNIDFEIAKEKAQFSFPGKSGTPSQFRLEPNAPKRRP